MVRFHLWERFTNNYKRGNMDISLLAEARQRKIDALDNQISQAETAKVEEEAVRDKLHELMSQSSYSISDINFLVEASK